MHTLLSVYSIAEVQRVFDEGLPTTKVGAHMNAASAAHPPVDAESKADPVRMGFPIDSPGGPLPPHRNRFISAPCTPPAHHTAHKGNTKLRISADVKWRREEPKAARTSE